MACVRVLHLPCEEVPGFVRDCPGVQHGCGVAMRAKGRCGRDVIGLPDKGVSALSCFVQVETGLSPPRASPEPYA